MLKSRNPVANRRGTMHRCKAVVENHPRRVISRRAVFAIAGQRLHTRNTVQSPERYDAQRAVGRDGALVSEHYDVIIVGSGAGGGTLAHTLAPAPAGPDGMSRRERPWQQAIRVGESRAR